MVYHRPHYPPVRGDKQILLPYRRRGDRPEGYFPVMGNTYGSVSWKLKLFRHSAMLLLEYAVQILGLLSSAPEIFGPGLAELPQLHFLVTLFHGRDVLDNLGQILFLDQTAHLGHGADYGGGDPGADAHRVGAPFRTGKIHRLDPGDAVRIHGGDGPEHVSVGNEPEHVVNVTVGIDQQETALRHPPQHINPFDDG